MLTDVKRQDGDALLVTYRRGRNTFRVPVLPSSTNEEFKAAVKRKARHAGLRGTMTLLFARSGRRRYLNLTRSLSIE